MLGNGKFWMWFWLTTLAIMIVWGILTILWWKDSVINLNMLSVAAIWLACGAGIQSTLAMRKADPRDPV